MIYVARVEMNVTWTLVLDQDEMSTLYRLVEAHCYGNAFHMTGAQIELMKQVATSLSAVTDIG